MITSASAARMSAGAPAEQHGPGQLGGLPAFGQLLEGRLQLVGEQQLPGDRLVGRAHPHRHRAHRVGAADRAAELGDDAVRTETGRDDPGVEHVRHRAQMHHGA